MTATAGPPSKRQKTDLATEDFDDEELLALAQTQMPDAGYKGVAAAADVQSANFSVTSMRSSVLPSDFHSTQEALDEEQEIAELVRLANSAVPQSDHAAAEYSMDDMPESSTAAADRVQEASTSSNMSAKAPAWSGANITGESITITLSDGRRAFCGLHPQQEKPPSCRQNRHGKLLSIPIGSLIQDVEQDAFAKAIHNSEVLQAATASSLSDVSAAAPHQLQQQTLWVDKYSPRSFFELLSDEQVNRDVVKWVKAWDACAHGKQAASVGPLAAQLQQGPEQKLLLLSGPPGTCTDLWLIRQCGVACNLCSAPTYNCFAYSLLFLKSKMWVVTRCAAVSGLPICSCCHAASHPAVRYLSRYMQISRPLAGAAGLGKTTIAHVVARHCGYRPFEINASDDRTATALQSKIQDAVQMQSVLGKRQMNLVIVDEVDGIAGEPPHLQRSRTCSALMDAVVMTCLSCAGGSEGRSAVQVLLKLTQASGGTCYPACQVVTCGTKPLHSLLLPSAIAHTTASKSAPVSVCIAMSTMLHALLTVLPSACKRC